MVQNPKILRKKQGKIILSRKIGEIVLRTIKSRF
jgi:hypothetical protein